MRARHFAPLLLICISLTACGGGEKEPKASDSPPPTAEEIAYHDCLKKQGVAIVYTDYGAPRVDKTKPWNEAAHKACESMLPPRPKPDPVAPEQLAAAQKEAACLRAEGVSWYPDPDPVTAEIDQTKGTPEQWSALKRDHVEALKKCRTHK
ncbi:hypothetical protein ACGFZK_32935 [Streptomyces sp. NPDC048257]|uniref:hypothetical protein n=1 Tax=Streptomyces sp. NPDC048257 TaxID=3365526 RepID=UPI00371BAB55